jgi:AraC-like DNA-binding protein
VATPAAVGTEATATPSLTRRRLLDTADIVLEDVRCGCRAGPWSAPEEAGGYGVVFVRRGCFKRRVNGRDSLVDPAVAYFERPDDEQQVAHPRDGGDACTAIALSRAFVDSVRADGLDLPLRSAFTSPQADLRHRLLLHADDPDELAEDASLLVLDLLTDVAGRPRAPVAERKRVVESAREAIAADPTLGVVDLARDVAVSPHHLSRVFRALTGETISRYRNRLRVRLALERIGDGERCLARLAADLGFSDQAHLSRVMRREVGSPPSQLRERLAP